MGDFYDDDDDFNYDDDDFNYEDDDDIDMGNHNEDDFIEEDELFVEKTYFTVLEESQIRQRQERNIAHVASTLFVSIPVATRLLHHFKWKVSELLDRWFVDEAKIRDEVGLSHTTSTALIFRNTGDETVCTICYESYSLDDFNFYPADCGHIYCVTCWNKYITMSIDGGPGCLSLRCPYPKCKTAVCRDVVEKIVGDVEREKYDRFLFGSYIEESKKAKWCPAAGCDNAVEFDIGHEVYDVTCSCKHSFCWNCVEEAHRPVDCKTVAKWILKNSSESENTAWIIANSKPCPKCNRAIEKNHGCMHMTCTAPCYFEFCWLCLGDWTEHGEATGGFYSCNRYEADKIKGTYNEDELKRRLAKKHVAKYTHYYERWDGNDKSRQKAVEEIEQFKNEKLSYLMAMWEKPETELEFILDAWKQIVECRRLLKWSYAYGYYIPEEQSRKREYFEYVQGMAESNLERLHKCVEKEILELLHEECVELTEEQKNELWTKLLKYQQKLVGLTKVTKSFFETLVRDLEKGLTEFDMNEKEISDTVAAAALKSSGGDDGLDDEYEYWTCRHCTFANFDEDEVCEVCNIARE